MVSPKKVFSSLIWQFMQNTGTKIVAFFVSIILARLLMPSDYGILAIVNAFVAFCDVLAIAGFGSSLVHKKDAEEADYSTIFYFQLVLAVVVYIGAFFAAPHIAIFFGPGYESLKPTIRVLGLKVIVLALSNVHSAMVAKKMQFKLSFFATLTGTLLSATVGIVMAMKGFGVWALVAQALSASVFHAIALWLITKWRPKIIFSFTHFKPLFQYGWKLACVSLLESVYQDIRSLIIGKMYTSQSLAYYNKGEAFPSLISTNINSSIKTVFFSAVALEQENKVQLKNMMKRAIKVSSYLLSPFLVGLFVVADNLVPVLLTEKWNPCIPYLQIFCLIYIVRPIQTTNMQVYKGVGKVGINLVLEIIKKTIGIAMLIIAIRFGPFAIACAYTVSSVINAIISALPNKRIINYGIGEQLRDMLPNFLLTLAFAVPVWFLGKLQINQVLVLAIQIAAGVLLYVCMSALLKNESFAYVKNLIFSKEKKKN